MARVGNRGETHATFDGEFWHLYTERKADMRRFELWFGKPTRRGRDGACAHWECLPAESMALRRRRRVGPKRSQDRVPGGGSSGRASSVEPA